MTRTHRRKPLFLSVGLILAAPAAFAQQAAPASDANATELDRITVTAQKREQQIQEVPISINAYSGEFLREHGIGDYTDLSSLVPGFVAQTQSVSKPSFSIRGINTDLDDPTQETRISLFQDGVSISRERAATVEMFDLERVEVLRGPQGTLFGRAAEAGAVHFIENKAQKGTSAGFEIGAGNYNERKATGFFNTDVGDGVQARFAVFDEKRDGYVDNLDGGTLQGKDTFAARASLHFDAGDSGGLDLILNWQNDSPPGEAFRSMVIPNEKGSLDPYVASSQRGERLGTDRDVYGATLLGDFALNDDWTLSTITGWRRYDGQDRFDADGSQADMIEFDEHAWGDQISQEVRFNFDNGGSFTGFVGGSYFDENAHRDLDYQGDERQLYALYSGTINGNVSQLLAGALMGPPYNYPADVAVAQAAALANYYYPVIPFINQDGTPNTSTASLWLPVPNATTPGAANPLGLPQAPLNPDHRETFGNSVSIKSFDLFADGTWHFSDAWSLTVGARATHDDSTYGYHADGGTFSALGYLLSGRTTPACAGDVPLCTNLIFPYSAPIEAEGSWTSWVGRAVLGWQIDEDNNAYASVSRGRRPAMINLNDAQSDEVPAEILTSYELGLKGATPGGAFVYDLSLYYYDYSNFQASVQNPTPPPFFVTTNAGRAHALGFETSLLFNFSRDFSGYLNYGHIDAGFNAFDKDGTHQELAGNEFRLTPKDTVAVGLDWRVPLADGRKLFVRPSYNWRSHVFFSDSNDPDPLTGLTMEQDAYGLYGLNAGIDFGKGWEFAVWGDNLADKEYLIDAGNTGQTFGIPTLIPGPRRSYGVTLSAKF